MLSVMKNFIFILSSTDHRALDSSLRNISLALVHPETNVSIATLAADKTKKERIYQRKLFITTNDSHVMDKLQKVDLVHSVFIHGVTQ